MTCRLVPIASTLVIALFLSPLACRAQSPAAVGAAVPFAEQRLSSPDSEEDSGGLRLLARYSGAPLVAEQEAHAVAFSPDGKQLVSGGGSGPGLILWDAQTGAVIGSFSGDAMNPSAIEFSPDGKLLAASEISRRIALFDPTTRQVLRYLDGHTDNVYGFAFSPNGRQLASRDASGNLLLWDLATGTSRSLASDQKSTGELAFSPDGRFLAVPGNNGVIAIWDIASAKKLRESEGVSGGTTAVHGLTYAPEGKTLFSGETLSDRSDVVVVRDAITLKVKQTLKGHTMHINQVRVSKDGRLLFSASGDGTLRIWDSTTGAAVRVLSAQAPLWSLSLAPDGESVASAGGGRKIHLYRTRTGDPVHAPGGHEAAIDALAFSRDGQLLASADANGHLVLRDLSSNRPSLRFPKQQGYFTSLSFSPDGSRLLSVSKGDARFWDPRTGTMIGSLSLGPHEALVFSPNGQFLAASNDTRIVRLLDSTTGAVVRTFGEALPNDDRRQNLLTPSSVSFSPEGKFLAVARWDQPIQVWEIATGTLVHSLPGTLRVAYSPKGDVIAGNVGLISKRQTSLQIKLWDATTEAELLTLDGTSGPWFAAGGQALLAFHDPAPSPRTVSGTAKPLEARELRLWRIPDGKPLGTVSSPGHVPVSLAVSPSGDRIATGGRDASVLLYSFSPDDD